MYSNIFHLNYAMLQYMYMYVDQLSLKDWIADVSACRVTLLNSEHELSHYIESNNEFCSPIFYDCETCHILSLW